MSRKKKDLATTLTDELTRELESDAQAISDELTEIKAGPDVVDRPDGEYRAFVARLYDAEDRETLTLLARADPQAFLKAFKALGGVVGPQGGMSNGINV